MKAEFSFRLADGKLVKARELMAHYEQAVYCGEIKPLPEPLSVIDVARVLHIEGKVVLRYPI